MQKTALNIAAALALATFGAGTAFAQSSLTLYGNADVSVDSVKVGTGVNLAPQLNLGAGVIPTAGKVATPGRVTRVSPSGTSQTSFGLKGEENLGGGYKASFVLEGQLGHDTGALGQDGRLFGRQSYVALTTPVGEVRLGRQYAPIFYSTAVVTTERFGATDLFIEGGSTNNLMVRQDNQMSYWLRAGGLTASIAYSPNAGSYQTITPARGANGNATTGGILGAIGAGTETDSKLGRSIGAFANYAFNDAFNTSFGYHRNDFDGARVATQLNVGGTPYSVVSGITLQKYEAANIGAKYVFPSSQITLSGAFGYGDYHVEGSTGDDELKVQFMAVGLRVPVDAWTFSAQASQIKFKNFTKGKDTGLLLGAEYALSKRTTLYARVGQIKDDEGRVSNDAQFGIPGVASIGGIVGGPDVIAAALGLREIPVYAGAGINPGGKTTYIGAGVRHTF